MSGPATDVLADVLGDVAEKAALLAVVADPNRLAVLEVLGGDDERGRP